MDLIATLFSTGWASGVNAYGTVALLGILGRAGVGDVPDSLESDPVIAAAAVMFAIEFVTDKVPYLDNLWDTVHTFVRPLVGGAVGALFAGDADVSSLEEVFSAGGSGATAFFSHSVKAGIRLGINTSPEPASNILVSLTEDGLVALVIVFVLEQPVLAAVIAAVLLATGGALVVFLAKRIRRGWRRLRGRWRGPPQSSKRA
jgi:hypothetical protein